MKKRINLVFAILICLFLLAGCQTKNVVKPADVPNTSVSTTAPQNASSDSSRVQLDASGKFRIVTDFGDNKVQVPLAKDINRVVNCWNSSNQVMFLLGAQTKLVGTSLTVSNSVWFNNLYPPMSKLYVANPMNGTYNNEEIKALAPDLIIVSNQKDYENLTKAGFNVVNVTL